eukprot:m.500372 g.500372  ORF g.500372 m.500372 type:complete len:464 (+) comp60636_c0_seq1:201-1592(+)
MDTETDTAVQQMNLSALRRDDPCISKILGTSGHVTVYDFQNNAWQRKDVEGTLFVYERSEQPYWGFYVMNRLHVDNVNQHILPELEFHVEEGPFIFYRTSKGEIHGLWFYSDDDRQTVSTLLHGLKAQCDAGTPPIDQPAAAPVPASGGPDLLQMLQAGDNPDAQHLTALFQRAASRSRTTSENQETEPQTGQAGQPPLSGPLGQLFAKAMQQPSSQAAQPAQPAQPPPAGGVSADASALSGLLSKAFGSGPTQAGAPAAASQTSATPAPQPVQAVQQPAPTPAAQQPQPAAEPKRPRTKHAHVLQAPGGIVPPQARPSSIPTQQRQSASATTPATQAAAPVTAASPTTSSPAGPKQTKPNPQAVQQVAVNGSLKTALPQTLKLIANEQLRHHKETQQGQAPLINPQDIAAGKPLATNGPPMQPLTKTQLQRALLQLFEKDSSLLTFVHDNYLRLFDKMTANR